MLLLLYVSLNGTIYTNSLGNNRGYEYSEFIQFGVELKANRFTAGPNICQMPSLRSYL